VVALIWNERLTEASTFMSDYDELVERYRNQGESGRRRLRDDQDDQSIRRFFGATGYELAKFENPQLLDRAGLIDRIVSSSYMPLPGDPRHEELLNRVQSLFDVHQQNQSVQVLQETRVYHGKLD
jgi:hypothetical protein